MDPFFTDLSLIEKIFMCMACFGGVVFALMTTIQFMGADADTDADGSTDADFDGDQSGDPSFKVFSVQGLSSFFFVSGLTGLALSRDIKLPEMVALAGALAAGGAILVILKKIFELFLSFRSDGTLNLDNALSEKGEVYLTIPQVGEGEVQVTVQGRLQILPAISALGIEIPTGAPVRVVDVVNGRFVKVEAIAMVENEVLAMSHDENDSRNSDTMQQNFEQNRLIERGES